LIISAAAIMVAAEVVWSPSKPFSVIARESGQSSNHRAVRDYWIARLRGR
jgi:hypothetical protein